ncbi:uncharacterized protein LOC119288543 [Triticum dicoccoides]|uniref:uncharacterized protein LOC119288543 n=1 Tax=Triticum dicoccoides TaxID=85692 RepID=UPI00188E151C|nr:uncharacterized protein LOC119288543 [Triticum dicoccoides]
MDAGKRHGRHTMESHRPGSGRELDEPVSPPPRIGSSLRQVLAADVVAPSSHALLEREPCPCCTPARERAQRRLLLWPAPQVPQRRLPRFVSGPCLACVTSRARSPRPAPPVAGALVPKSCAAAVREGDDGAASRVDQSSASMD